MPEAAPRLCLIVAPSTTVRRILGRALDALGPWAVLQTGDGAEGRAALAEGPTLIVAERQLPGMPDLEIVRAARVEERTARAVVVVLSARRDAAAVREAKDAGADSVLFHPADFAAWVARLQSLVPTVDVAPVPASEVPEAPPVDAPSQQAA